MSRKQLVYWWVEVSVEFLPGKTIRGLDVTPRFTCETLAERAKNHLLERYGIEGEVVSTGGPSPGGLHREGIQMLY